MPNNLDYETTHKSRYNYLDSKGSFNNQQKNFLLYLFKFKVLLSLVFNENIT